MTSTRLPRVRSEITHLLPRIGVPTLILWGEDDTFQLVKYGERLAEDVSDARVVRIANAGHFVMFDQPDAVAEHLRSFLAADSVQSSNRCLRIEPNSSDGYELLWKAKRVLSHYVSPLAHNGHVYFLNKVGVLYCLDAKTGDELYAQRTSGPCWAQPIAAGNHVYLFHKNGEATVVTAGDEFGVVAKNRLWPKDQPPLPNRSYDFSPPTDEDTRPRKPAQHYMDPLVYGVAAVDGAFVVRLGTHLYCVGQPGPPLSEDRLD